MRINWKKLTIVTLDVVLAAYIVIAFMAFNKPNEVNHVCTQVNINTQHAATNRFITAPEIKARFQKTKLYPLGKPLKDIDARHIEETLKQSPFVKNAECYKTEDGHVSITLTQRMPTLRIKAENGDDYYLDDKDSIMPNSHYTSDLVIATGNISRWYARNYVSHLADALMSSEFWKNQIEQIHVLPNHGIELIPRVGDHIIYIGQLPETIYTNERKKLVTDYVSKKMDRMEKFYKYGLSQAGWNKYSYINVEFSNQIICKKRKSN